jgi:uncharacterized protein (TIGR01777 family)
MNIGITGASGFIGSAISQEAAKRGYGVIGFSRHPERNIDGCQQMRGLNAETKTDLSGCDAIIHLAGENVFGLWTAEKKKRILQSRQEGTRRLVDAIRESPHPPGVLVCASAIGFYGDTGEQETNETAAPGTGFLAEVTQAWEHEAQRAAESAVRVVLLRIAVVLGENGGALSLMAPIFKMGLGGKIGDGKQWRSWIHRKDLCDLALFAVENSSVAGPLNASAPEPVRNAHFTQALGRALNRPAIFTVPGFLLKGALGEFSRELLDSKRIVPSRPISFGYQFHYPILDQALKQLFGKA